MFTVVFTMLLLGLFTGWRFCNRNNININTFSGMFEMYSRIFKFENKSFSILMLVCMYGGALIVFMAIGITLWAEGQGCVFPTRYG
jgi:hypothetical protein